MKKLIFFIIAVFLFLNFLSLKSLDAATMNDYCIVPPYVIQDVPPNVMIVLDNSGSMFNLAYACPKTNTTSAGTGTTVIPVDDVTGFQVRQQIALVHAGTGTRLQISSINATNKTITVTQSVDFSTGDIVQDYGCYGTIFYEGGATCASTTTTSAGASVTIIPVNSVTNFWVGEIIAVASTGGPYERVITAISPSDKKITVNSAVTFASGNSIYDYNCYYLMHPYPEQSFIPTKDYYGYFNSDYWYTYSSSGGRFSRSRLKSAGAKASTEWDGNFMNWLTMRRVDIIKKVMTGGKTTTSSRLVTEKSDADDRGIYKVVFNAGSYMGCTNCTGNINVTFSTGSSNPSSFTAYSGPGAPSSWTDRGSFSVYVVTPDTVEGVLQDAVGTRARLGLMFYNTNDGGFVQVNIAAANLASAVSQINNKRPNANTPLGETLYTVAGYFARYLCSASSTGPMYHNADYPCNDNGDPYNYGTGGQNRWPSCSKSYVLYITDGEPCQDGDLPSSLVDYAGTSPHISTFNCSGTSCPARVATSPETYNFPGTPMLGDPACSGYAVAGMEDVALWAHTTDLRNSTTYGYNNMSGIQNLTLFNVFAFGKGSTLLRYAAINGGFEDINGNNLPDLQSEWDQNGDGEPDNFYEAYEGYEIEQAIRSALSTILKRAASGTAASVLASGEGSGANLVQAVFYPRRRIGNDIIGWIGEDQNMWYYVDPFFTNSSIREDSTADQILNLTNDNIVRFYFDTTAQITKARRFRDTDGNGTADVEITPPILFENIASLWKAGQLLWSRTVNPSNPADTNNRTIYTTTNGTSLLANNFTVTNKTALRPYLQAVDDLDAEYIIRYTHGEGLTTLLDEDGTVVTAGIDRKGTCSVTATTSCTINANCPGAETCVPDGIDDYRPRYGKIGSDTNVWKLGDILNSTPRIASWVPLNNYDVRYKDTTYSAFTATTGSTGYKGRGMVFAGGNDGMLHALNLGKLELTWTSPTQAEHEIARLSGSDLGKEMWAFIPKNALPYLKYITDPDYCHVYSVDLSPYLFDASIGAPGSGDLSNDTRPNCPDPYDSATCTWRTILIGGMRYGGACRKTGVACNSSSCSVTTSKSCTTDANCSTGETCVPNCVRTPLLDPGDASKGLGYSSYFALDVTDQNNPQLLWEFSDPALGFATSGPAVVRIGSDNIKNGKWFVVFGSGPTGPIQTIDHQFVGSSDQNLKLFIFDIKAGPGANNANVTPIDTTIPYAFAGSMLNSTLDYNEDYQDDVVYIGYVKRTGSGSIYTWTDGGIGRLFTKNDSNPSNWVWSKVIDGIGPVTSSVARLQNDKTHILWLFFGSGRYYYEIQTNVDDPDSQRTLFAVKEPCFTSSNILDTTCTTLVSSGVLTNVTSIGSVPTETIANSASFKGWYINLDASGNYPYLEGTSSVTRAYRAERMITDPMATTTGLAFFTTYKPYNDECGLGGKSFIWAVRYNTGGAAGALLKGTALLQVSTGSIEQLNLSTAFTEAGGRKSAALEGVPPTAQGLSLLSQPPAVKRVLHIRER
ncbi:MAG: hypothetical protein A2Y81_08525 [Nitrospirae bacterium RBG_13_43_8]|nr:MAG: hypothetical protein A2Y81_08525 [Nitrospirae bacterium RBG_13_43_8]